MTPEQVDDFLNNHVSPRYASAGLNGKFLDNNTESPALYTVKNTWSTDKVIRYYQAIDIPVGGLGFSMEFGLGPSQFGSQYRSLCNQIFYGKISLIGIYPGGGINLAKPSIAAVDPMKSSPANVFPMYGIDLSGLDETLNGLAAKADVLSAQTGITVLASGFNIVIPANANGGSLIFDGLLFLGVLS